MFLKPKVKKVIRRWLWPLLPGWVDEGRRIVQGPHLRELLERAVRESPAVRIFNAGTGEGGYSPLLLELPGVELVAETDYGFQSQRPSPLDRRQIFFCSSLVSVPVTDRRFDLVLCTEVLEHIEEDDQALDELTRVLTPGGWLLITVPTPPAVSDPSHVREGYDPHELAGMLADRGFKIVESRFCMYFFFRSALLSHSRLRWIPSAVIRGLALLDKLFPLGRPMDLMILAQLGTR
jgi:SAM-dependent methyltransferase